MDLMSVEPRNAEVADGKGIAERKGRYISSRQVENED
jgi:hypothetical protein